MTIVAHVVEQHAEEAAFLWLLRSRAVDQPHYSLSDLARLDTRVEAHLDGLRLAGEDGWAICAAKLADSESDDIFPAAILALEGNDSRRLQSVIDAVGKDEERARGLISALGWLSYSQVTNVIKRLLEADPPLERRVGVAAAAIHRRGVGPVLVESLSDPDRALRARAFRAVGELGTVGMLRILADGLTDEDVECRFWATWSSTLLGDSKALRALQGIAERPGPRREHAAKLAARRMDHTVSRGWQRDLARDPGLERVAVITAGAIGDPAAIPWLIAQMATSSVARVAGEAFTTITGVDLAFEDLEGDRPSDFESGPTEDAEDEDVALDSDENLPWPDPSRVERWWGAHRATFKAGTRHLFGQPIAQESLQHVLRRGRQRHRAAGALELAIARPGDPLFEVRAPGFRQRQILNSTR